MSCIKVLRRWIQRIPSPDATQASEAAAASLVQAGADYAKATAGRAEADGLVRTLREHNASNRYDEWLRRVIT